jgi:hypothetical protein
MWGVLFWALFCRITEKRLGCGVKLRICVNSGRRPGPLSLTDCREIHAEEELFYNMRYLDKMEAICNRK